MIINLNPHSTLTVPAGIRRRLGIGPGDSLDLKVSKGSMILTPVSVVPRKLRLSPSGTKKEAAAEKQARSGKIKTFPSSEELIKAMNENKQA